MSVRPIVALALLVLAPVLGAQAPERHVLRGARVAIWNLAGRTEIVPTTGTEVIVELTRGGPDGAALTVRASGSELAVVYPDRAIRYDDVESSNYSTRLRVNDDGTFASDGSDGSAGRTTTISNRRGSFEGHANLRILVPAGQTVEVNIAVGTIDATDVRGNLDMRTRFSPITASNITGTLGAHTGSGSVRVEGVEGAVSTSTGSGSITVTRATGAPFRASTGSGSLRLREITTSAFTAGTGSGGITVEGLSADDVRATTGSGSIRLELTKVPRNTVVRSGSGSAHVSLPANPNIEVDISTGSGGISSDFPVTMQSVRRNELKGTIGDGSAGSLRASTGSGSVRLLRN